MLGLVLIYFIGRAFYQLAEAYGKHQWGHAILGVVSYYGGTIIAGIVMFVIYDLSSLGSIDEMNEMALNLMAVPFGLLACWGVYKLLERRWDRAVANSNDDILDDGLL